MQREDNIFYAKRNLVDSIWKEARIEGIGVTFPETQEIVEGRSVAGLSVDDVLLINNLKHAWQYVFDTLDEPLTLEWVQGLNLKIGEGGVVRYAGDLRTGLVTVGGTDWVPSVPDAAEIELGLEKVNAIEDPLDRALTALGFISRAQMFNDGNKRTAQLAANKLLIESGEGILAIPEKHKVQFLTKLLAFYETNDLSNLKAFLIENCVDHPEIGTSEKDSAGFKRQSRDNSRESLSDTLSRTTEVSKVLEREHKPLDFPPSRTHAQDCSSVSEDAARATRAASAFNAQNSISRPGRGQRR